jgi:predicted RNase H-like HicB family nuclease
MAYQVLVERVPEGFFAATVIGVPDCVAEGATKEEAVENASARLKERLAKAELFTIEGPASCSANPWLEIHGSLRDDPTFDDLVSEIDSYRRESGTKD